MYTFLRWLAVAGLLLGLSSAKALAEEPFLVFSETFDPLEDWTSTLHSTNGGQTVWLGDVLPGSWSAIYQGTSWSPEKGHNDRHASLEILATNAAKARGESGKSAVFWRESMSLGWNNWASDAQFLKVLEEEYDELYIEYWIRFSPDWWHRNNHGNWSSKMFRVGSYRGTGSIFNGAGGNVGPRLIWNYKLDAYGARNSITLLEGPHGATGNTATGVKGSRNFTSHTRGMGENGQDPKVPDLVNGGYLVDFSGSTTHDQVYGPTDRWTKLGFYVRINSAPGVADGVLRQWINDVQFHNDEEVTWITDNPSVNPEGKMVGWNYFGIGGNDYFQPIPNEQRFEDWYAIDDVRVYSRMPTASNPPSPPMNFRAVSHSE